MSISRNATCPCGSGKKYKKCCLNKKAVVQINEVKEERFFQQKHLMVGKMQKFVEEKVPFNQFLKLKTEFSQRSNNSIPANVQDGFFQFWLYFCRRYENGLRGIEWFYQEQKLRFSNDEREMAKTWTGLSLKMLQAIKKVDSQVVFEDALTKETFSVVDSRENIPEFTPWYSTLGLLEAFDEKYYFNGVRIFKGPDELQQAIKLVQELVATEKKSLEQILFDFYPEIISAFVVGHTELTKEDLQEKEIQEFTVEYKISNSAQLENFLFDHEDLVVDVWDNRSKKLSWAGNWRAYKDSELEDEIQLADVFATISIEKEKLVFLCYDQQKKEELQAIFARPGLGIEFLAEMEKAMMIPFNAVIKNSFVQMSETTPQFFAIYAQTDLIAGIDTPLPKYGNASIRQLVETDQLDLAEAWLKQLEYNLYQHVLQKFNKVEVTADFNTVRNQLGLPLSPFVTGGENRHTAVFSIVNPFRKQISIPEEDLPLYEELGFNQATINQFYSKDLIAFFKEKTSGKGDGTVRKYRNSLYLIRRGLDNGVQQSWSECSESFWEQLIVKEIVEAESVSKTFQKDLFSTIKAFTKWIDQTNDTSISQAAARVIKDSEKQLVKA